MKNKIRLPKKIIQIFSLFFLIIGFFILVNFINKTISPNQNALASYSCSGPNEEVMRTSNQMCFLVCGSHGGYLRQDFNALKCCCKGNGIVPTPSVTVTVTATQPSQLPTQIVPIPTQNQNPRCTFNPSKTCSPGSTWIEYNGFCGCLVNKRCLSETSQLYDTPNHYLSWIEEYKDDKWQMFQTCLYPEPICDTNTFRCVSMGPTGPKKFGEVCQTGSECQSGECDSQYTSYSGDEIILIRKQCTYSLIDQGKFANKRHDTDTKLSLAAASLVVATVTSPLIAEIYPIAATAGTSYAASRLLVELQQPWAQNTFATLNLTSTLYAISDCAKNGTNGEWCNMLAAMATGNPGQFGQILGDDLSTISKNITKINVAKYLNLASKINDVTESTYIPETAVTFIDDAAETVLPYQPLIKTTKGPWPIGESFPSNRGGKVVVDRMIGSGGLGNVYKATLFEPNVPPKAVVIKFPKTFDPETVNIGEIVSQVNEQYLLAKGANSLPTDLQSHLARPYGFISVETSIGEVKIPVIENLGSGQTLGTIIGAYDKISLSQSQVDALYRTAQKLDNEGIFLRDIFVNNIYITDKGNLIFFDPYVPRLNSETGTIITNTWRRFSKDYVTRLHLNTSLLSFKSYKGMEKWIFEVPINNVAALNKMFKLYNNVISIK